LSLIEAKITINTATFFPLLPYSPL